MVGNNSTFEMTPEQAIPRIQADIKKAEATVLTGLKKIIKETFIGIVEDSPIDTGEYVANHRFTLGGGRVNRQIRLPGFENQAFSEMVQALEGFTLAKGQKARITNPTRQAEFIENGVSGQAPVGVYQIHALRALAKIQAL